MKALIRLGLVAGIVATAAFAVPQTAFAQGNTDEAHDLCAQGGGETDSGAGGGAFNQFDPDNPANETAAFGNGRGGSEDEGGAGGGGPGGGLGGAENVGGGAGGCGRDVPDPVVHPPVVLRRPRPVIIVRQGRRLPKTGTGAADVAMMGGGLVLTGAAFVAATRRKRSLVEATPDGLVWDAFGWRRES